MYEGLYESVLTGAVLRELAPLSELESEIGSVDPADQAHVLARHLSAAVERRLTSEKDPDRRIALANRVTALMDELDQSVEPPVRLLQSLRRPPGPGSPARYDRRPATPLNDVALLTNSHGEPSLASELRAELR